MKSILKNIAHFVAICCACGLGGLAVVTAGNAVASKFKEKHGE